MRNVPTIQATDAEFFVEDDNLHLAFAHRGNIMNDVHASESTLLKFDPETSAFDIIQGYKGLDENKDNEIIPTDASFITRNPQRVIYFKIHNRNYLVFVNKHGDKYSIDDDKFSYIYKFNEATSKFELFQKLLTFNAVDAVIVKIPDPQNALNCQWYLIFANKENSKKEQVDSLVYKFTGSKFVIHQSLQHSATNKPISVAATSRTKGDDSRIMQNAVMFLMQNGKLEFYQFDGFNFHHHSVKDAPPLTVNSEAVSPVSIELSAACHMKEDPHFFIKYDSGNTREVGLDFEDSESKITNPRYTANKGLKDYMTSVKDQWNGMDIKNIFENFETMPRTSATDIWLEDVTFNAGFSVDHVVINAKYDEKIDSAALTIKILDEETHNDITIDSGLLDELKKYDDGEFGDNLSNLVQEVDDLKVKIAAGVKRSSDDALDNEVVFENIEFGTKSKVVAKTFEVNIDEESEAYRGRQICASSKDVGAKKYDLVEFMKNTIRLDASPNLIADQVSFENLVIEKEYSIGKINEESVTNIWQSDKDREIAGTTTFGVASTFKGATSAATVGDLKFSKDEILLTSGEQKLDIPFTFSKGDVTILDITMKKVNDFNLADMDKYITWDDKDLRLNTIDLLKVDKLILPKLSFDNLKTLTDDDGFVVSSDVNMRDLTKLSMKKTGIANEVSLKYNFKKKVEATSVTAITVNNLDFDEDFVAIDDDFSGTTLTIDNIVAKNVQVNEAINTVDVEDDEVGVDDNGDLELLLLRSHSGEYKHQVDSVKTFDTVEFKNDVDTDEDDVFGYNVNDHDGVSTYEQAYSISNLVLNNVEGINKIALDKGAVVSQDGTVLDFSDIYTNGLRRSIASWPSTITEVNFKPKTEGENVKVEFMKNVNVNKLNNLEDDDFNDVDPEADFLPLVDPGDLRTFTAPVVFEDIVTLHDAPTIVDEEKTSMKSCMFGRLEKCRCKDCNDPKCEILGDECYVKDSEQPSVEVTSLYKDVVSNPLKNIDDNMLKTTGDQSITPNLKFLAGFEAETLTVNSEDCTHFSIDCGNIALKNIKQDFSGTNKINGDVTASVVSVDSSLDVDGVIDGVDIGKVYTDTLIIKQDSPMTVIGKKTFSEDVQVETFASDGQELKLAEKTFEFGNDFVLREDESAVLASDVVFNNKIDVKEFEFSSDSVTWDSVSIGSFFDNLLTHGSSQVISGDLTIVEDLTINAGLEKDETNVDAVSMINSVDIGDIETKALTLREMKF